MASEGRQLLSNGKGDITIKDNKIRLLNAVKKAAAQNDITGISIRTIAETAGMNDALIYRYFRDKDDLLRQTYEQESNAIFYAMLAYLDEVHGTPLAFRDKARLVFHRVWREFLADPERLHYVTAYFHSVCFKKDKSCHLKQLELLIGRTGNLFPDDNICTQTMYSLMTLIYDCALRVIENNSPDTPETEERTFSMFYGLLTSQLKPEYAANQTA